MNVLRLGDHVRTEAVPVMAHTGHTRRVLEGRVVELGADHVRVDVKGFHYPPRFSYGQVQRA